MLIPNMLQTKNVNLLYSEDYDDMAEHVALQERLRKTFYYGRIPPTDRPSLPMTELAVEFLHEAAPRELGKVDMYWASSVTRRAAVSPCSMILGMMYIERLKHKNPEYIQQISSSELFLISMMVASKYLYDEGITEEVFNEEWGESAKMDTEDINQMEREFLTAIDWSLFTKAEDFWRALESMEEKIALGQADDRGFFSYTDFLTLARNSNFRRNMLLILQDIMKVILACSVAYTAGCLTMVASPHALTTVQHHIHLPATPVVVPPSSTPESSPVDDIIERTVMTTPTTDENSTDELPARTDETRASPPHLGLPGFLTLALIKDTLLGLTRWNSNRSDADTTTACHSDNLRRDTDSCFGCSRLHGQCANRAASQARRPFLGQMSEGFEDHVSRSSHKGTMEQCTDFVWNKASVLSERVQSSFSDIIIGFQTTAYVPVAG